MSEESIPPSDHRTLRSDRKCVVCHAPRESFERFPSDTRQWNSPFPPHLTDPRRRYHVVSPINGLPYLLGPGPARVHRDYCSIRCYANPEVGHLAKKRQRKRMQKVRARILFYKFGRKTNPENLEKRKTQRAKTSKSWEGYVVHEAKMIRQGVGRYGSRPVEDTSPIERDQSRLDDDPFVELDEIARIKKNQRRR